MEIFLPKHYDQKSLGEDSNLRPPRLRRGALPTELPGASSVN